MGSPWSPWRSIPAERGHVADMLAEKIYRGYSRVNLGRHWTTAAAHEDNTPHLGESWGNASFCAWIPLDGVNATQAADMDTLFDRGLVERRHGELRLTAAATQTLRAEMVSKCQ